MQFFRPLILLWISCSLLFVAGCQDGPLYAIKAANPYYVLGEWKEDEKLGVTDHQRRRELAQLVDSMGDLPAERQEFWADHLSEIMANDQSAEMRRLAVRAAGQIASPTSIDLIDKGLQDDSSKVRMEACRSLAQKSEDQAIRLLAAAIGTETDQDVRHAAISALANHQSPIATDALRVALDDRNPATRLLVITSLKNSTGMDHGDDPQAWIAALDGNKSATPDNNRPLELNPGVPSGPFGTQSIDRIAEQPDDNLSR